MMDDEAAREEATTPAATVAPGNERGFYRVRLDVFEGPLDLLLHLIKKNEVEITAIPIATVTEQYLGYLDMMRELRLDVAGEFLVMAATLTLIKSRMLLPSAEDDEQEEPDPRAELVQQLLEYQRYREAALDLSERPLLQRDVFAREPAMDVEIPQTDATAPRLQVTVWELLEAFRSILRRARPEAVHEVVADQLSLRDRVRTVLDILQRERTVEFERLFRDEATRFEIVLTFLAMLELMKMGAITATQEHALGRIVIAVAVEDLSAVSLEGIDEYERSAQAEDSDGGGAG